MSADTLGSTVEAGKIPPNNSDGQYWENLAPAAFRNLLMTSAAAFYTNPTGTPTLVAENVFSRMFYLASVSVVEAYHEFTVGDCTGGEDIPVGDFFAFYVNSDSTTAGKKNIYIDHGSRLDQSVDVVNMEDATIYTDGLAANRYIGFAGVVTGTALPASTVMRFGIGCDNAAGDTQNLRVGMPTVLWVPASERTVTGNKVPFPSSGAGVFAIKHPANISFDTGGLGTVNAAGADFAGLRENFVGVALGDSWANEYANAGASDGGVIDEWMTKLGESKAGISVYGDARAGRTLADMDLIVNEILTVTPTSVRADVTSFGTRGGYDRLDPNFILLQGGISNSYVPSTYESAQALADIAAIYVKTNAAGVTLYLGNFAGFADTYGDQTTGYQDYFDEVNAGIVSTYSDKADVVLIDHTKPPITDGSPDFELQNQVATDPGHLDETGSQYVANSFLLALFGTGTLRMTGGRIEPLTENLVENLLGEPL